MKKGFWFWLPAGLLTAVALAIGLFTVAQAQSAADTETMTRANQLYENGRYREATRTYQQLLDKGITNSTLYYNLGNAYYKQGELGQAILNYERAAQLAPRDADIEANLEMARSQILDRYENESTGWLGRFVAATEAQLTLNEMATMTLFFWASLVAFVLLYRHTRREPVQYALILAALLFVITLFSLGSRLYVESSRPQAIVLAEQVDVLSGPGRQYVTEFNLHSGAKVSLLERRGTWARLALPGEQLQGWVTAESIAAIAPQQ